MAGRGQNQGRKTARALLQRTTKQVAFFVPKTGLALLGALIVVCSQAGIGLYVGAMRKSGSFTLRFYDGDEPAEVVIDPEDELEELLDQIADALSLGDAFEAYLRETGVRAAEKPQERLKRAYPSRDTKENPSVDPGAS